MRSCTGSDRTEAEVPTEDLDILKRYRQLVNRLQSVEPTIDLGHHCWSGSARFGGDRFFLHQDL